MFRIFSENHKYLVCTVWNASFTFWLKKSFKSEQKSNAEQLQTVSSFSTCGIAGVNDVQHSGGAVQSACSHSSPQLLHPQRPALLLTQVIRHHLCPQLHQCHGEGAVGGHWECHTCVSRSLSMDQQTKDKLHRAAKRKEGSKKPKKVTFITGTE